MKKLDFNKMIEEGMSISAIMAAVIHEQKEYEKKKAEKAEEAKREAELKAAEAAREENKRRESVAAARSELVDAFMAYLDALGCPIDDGVQLMLENTVADMEPELAKMSKIEGFSVRAEGESSGCPFFTPSTFNSKEDISDDDFVDLARKFLKLVR